MQVDGQEYIRVSKHNRNILNIIRINILCVKSDKNGTSASHNS